jgi:hypothetical protein
MFINPKATISWFPLMWYPFMDAKDRPTAVASCIRHNNRIYRLKVSDVDLVHFSWRMDLNYLIPTVIAMTATIELQLMD